MWFILLTACATPGSLPEAAPFDSGTTPPLICLLAREEIDYNADGVLDRVGVFSYDGLGNLMLLQPKDLRL